MVFRTNVFSKRVIFVERLIGYKTIKVLSTPLPNWIPIKPPLQIWFIIPVKVVNQTRRLMKLLGGEAIQVRVREWAGLADDVAERFIQILGYDDLIRIDQAGHVAIPIGVVIGMAG